MKKKLNKDKQSLIISFLKLDREDESTKLLEAANAHSAKITNFVMRYIVVGFLVSMIMMAFCKIIYDYIQDGFIDVDDLFIPFQARYTYIFHELFSLEKWQNEIL